MSDPLTGLHSRGRSGMQACLLAEINRQSRQLGCLPFHEEKAVFRRNQVFFKGKRLEGR